jgi:hypothetical protein
MLALRPSDAQRSVGPAVVTAPVDQQGGQQMSRMTTPVEADIPARPALDAAARQFGFVPNMHYALAASHEALNTWLDPKKTMNTALDAANRQGVAHGGEEVNA